MSLGSSDKRRVLPADGSLDSPRACPSQNLEFQTRCSGSREAPCSRTKVTATQPDPWHPVSMELNHDQLCALYLSSAEPADVWRMLDGFTPQRFERTLRLPRPGEPVGNQIHPHRVAGGRAWSRLAAPLEPCPGHRPGRTGNPSATVFSVWARVTGFFPIGCRNSRRTNGSALATAVPKKSNKIKRVLACFRGRSPSLLHWGPVSSQLPRPVEQCPPLRPPAAPATCHVHIPQKVR
jgi:hypothetical protein